eukprot:TRINITY_DN3801_c0_g1_i1.p1 TRINITY_DN3801_c0_g1~~TRINITY_DN3801_c0_g1_i1.p1  ORF type:complete len:168 (-),score=42.11 TRINITY_DN3801_c0_g1_i1:138-641(-)
MAWTTTGWSGIGASLTGALVDQSIFDAVKQQHQTITDLFTQLLQGNVLSRAGAWKDLRTHLKAHNKAEEEVIFKEIYSMGGEKVISWVATDHMGLSKILDDLDNSELTVDDLRWLEAVQTLQGKIEQHFAEEEMKVFEILRSLFPEEKLQQMGGKLCKEQLFCLSIE